MPSVPSLGMNFILFRLPRIFPCDVLFLIFFFFFYSSQVFLFSTLDFDEKIERDIFGRRIKFLEKLEDPFRARCSTLLSGTIFDLLVNARAIFNSFPAILSFYFNFLFYYFSLFLTNFYSPFEVHFFFFFLLLPLKTFDLCLLKFRNFKSIPALYIFSPRFSLARARENIYVFPRIHFHGIMKISTRERGGDSPRECTPVPETLYIPGGFGRVRAKSSSARRFVPDPPATTSFRDFFELRERDKKAVLFTSLLTV